MEYCLKIKMTKLSLIEEDSTDKVPVQNLVEVEPQQKTSIAREQGWYERLIMRRRPTQPGDQKESFY
jgi:hypothetical protein